MSVKLSNSIPEQVPDIKDEQSLKDFLIAVKLVVEELASKAQSRQMEIRSTVPSTDDIDEGSFVAYVNGATIKIYTKQSGVIRFWVLT